jgi:hypothetical protein
MDLFNNPMVNNALKAMTPEQISNYKKLGEHMYGNVNFVDSKIINNVCPPMEESVAYVEEGIKSGLLPCDLTEDEVILLTSAFGPRWFERYNFEEHEVPEAGLSLKVKNDIDEAVMDKIKEHESKKRDESKNPKKTHVLNKLTKSQRIHNRKLSNKI